jgi:hypothetical protein
VNHKGFEFIYFTTIMAVAVIIVACIFIARIAPHAYATTAFTPSHSPTTLKVSVSVGKNPIMRNNIQPVFVKVVNSATGKPVKDVSITVSITSTGQQQQHQPITKKFNGKTDQNGNWSFSWQIGSTLKTGLIGIDVKSSKIGYSNSYGSTFCKIIAKN